MNDTHSVDRAGRLSFYHRGHTSQFASRHDQRFSWCAYVPTDYDERVDLVYPLLVVVHGTERGAQSCRDTFAEFGERTGCVVLAPLFPCGIEEPGELNNYKWLEFRGLRFDRLLLQMIDEVADLYRVDTSRFLLHGFSGGGHFAHRFFYLHPDRLLGVSIGAPGVVTLLDPKRDWWIGVRGLEERFGRSLDLDRMPSVAVQMVIGAEDRETWEITLQPSDELWIPGANDAGITRLDRLESLKRSFQRHGIAVRHDVVAGVAHDGSAVLDPVKDFFSGVLESHRAG